MINHKKLKAARIEAGYKLRGIALEVGVSHQAIHQYESGKIIPSIEVLKRLCAVLRLDANEILMTKEGK